MKILILEDDLIRMKVFNRMFHKHMITHACNSDEAIKHLDKEKFDYIFLDHDLGGRIFVNSNEYDTGYRVAKYIPQSINKDTDVVIHSWNPAGAKNMKNILKDREKGSVECLLFGTFNENILKKGEK